MLRRYHERSPGATAPASSDTPAFDRASGKVQWQLWLDSDVMSAPVAAGDFVHVTTFNGTMIKIEQATGKVRYAIQAKVSAAHPPRLHDTAPPASTFGAPRPISG
ncbi:MAG TPA: PQQ-binding-like beta-propeller repeat protein [Kofleriaceae bacterium]|nr:PQQ-binding-like beta-propeller repeat protein [Kofleriaceae bacterium]